MNEIVGILLAAGSARRFGSHKLLQVLHTGVPVAVATAQALMMAVSRTVVVVKPDDQHLINLLTELNVEIVENPHAKEGMGTSLAAGIKATERADGWLIMLADMPWVRPDTLFTIVDRLKNGATIIAPVHAGQRGHPVGFSSHWLKALADLSGDRGARDVIKAHSEELELYATDDAGVLQDIDYPDDINSHYPC